MKVEKPVVICCYSEDGASIEEYVLSSFAVFLGRELEKFASVVHGHV